MIYLSAQDQGLSDLILKGYLKVNQSTFPEFVNEYGLIRLYSINIVLNKEELKTNHKIMKCTFICIIWMVSLHQTVIVNSNTLLLRIIRLEIAKCLQVL